MCPELTASQNPTKIPGMSRKGRKKRVLGCSSKLRGAGLHWETLEFRVLLSVLSAEMFNPQLYLPELPKSPVGLSIKLGCL